MDMTAQTLTIFGMGFVFLFLALMVAVTNMMSLIVDKIQPISTEIKKLLDDKSYLDNTLLEGVERANIIASKKIKRIKEIVGF